MTQLAVSKNRMSEKFFTRHSLSTYLFAVPGMTQGFARIFDLGTHLDSYNFSASAMSDNYAIASDWLMVGADMRSSIGNYEKQNNLSGRVF